MNPETACFMREHIPKIQEVRRSASRNRWVSSYETIDDNYKLQEKYNKYQSEG